MLLESNAGLFEQSNKLKTENGFLKAENKNKQVEIDELKTKITLMQEADKVIVEYRRQLEEKSKLLL